MRRKILVSCLLPVALIACATPSVTLKNDATGQVAMCGGSATGSMVGGAIGYGVQQSSDEACVRAYEAQGFKRVQ